MGMETGVNYKGDYTLGVGASKREKTETEVGPLLWSNLVADHTQQNVRDSAITRRNYNVPYFNSARKFPFGFASIDYFIVG